MCNCRIHLAEQFQEIEFYLMLGISVVYCELWDAWRNCKKHCIDVCKGFERQDTVEGVGLSLIHI